MRLIFVDDVSKIDLEKIGPRIEHHSGLFRPASTPIGCKIKSGGESHHAHLGAGQRHHARLRAPGACAVCVAGALTGRTGRQNFGASSGWKIYPSIGASRTICVYMTGPATEVFSGEWKP